MNKFRKALIGLLSAVLLSGCTGCQKPQPDPVPAPTPQVTESPQPTETPTAEPTPEPTQIPDPVPTIEPSPEAAIDEDGIYDTKDEVALYIYTYHHLPSNFMTKKEARKKGWEGGALHLTVEGMCIGGDYYGNYEGLLPEVGEDYYECDIDTLTRKQRGSKRIIYTESGDVWYTGDHYKSFEQLYDGDN